MATAEQLSVSIIGSDVVLDPNHHWLRRFIWMLLILSGLTLSIYQIIDRVSYYDSAPTAVSLEIRENFTLSFPKIMLCNKNSYNRTWLEEKNLTESVRKYQKLKFRAVSRGIELDDELLEGANIWYNTSRLDAAIKFDSIIYWDGGILDETSRSLYLTPVYSISLESICYVFDPPDDERQVIAGGGGGLHLNALTHGELDAAIDHFQLSYGYRLYVLSTDDSQDVLHPGINLEPGTFTNVPLEVKEFVHLPTRLGGICDEDQDESRSRCYLKCVMETSFNNELGCRPIDMSSLYDPCPHMRSIFRGARNYIRMLTNATHMDMYCKHCSSVRCHELEYGTGSVSAETLSVKHAYKNVKELMKYEYSNLTQDELVSDVVGLRVYFPSPRYPMYRQMKLYSHWALLCDIGGAMGLFVGSAVFTILEIIDIVLYRLCKKCVKR